MDEKGYQALPRSVRDGRAACRAACLFPRTLVEEPRGTCVAIEGSGRRMLVGLPGAYSVIDVRDVEDIVTRQHGEWVRMVILTRIPDLRALTYPWHSVNEARCAHYALLCALMESRKKVR